MDREAEGDGGRASLRRGYLLFLPLGITGSGTVDLATKLK